MNGINQEIYQRLQQVARSQDVTTYSEIAPLAGLDINMQDDRNRISEILGEISRNEHINGHSMLSAVVIHREDNIPGPGFLTLARELGLHRDNNNFMFFIRELRRVHDYW